MTNEFAEQVFRQISGFGEYGFPESHAASFAKLVYVSAWLKHYYPAAFCAAIINSQPMGFYAPAQLVADAQKHGVNVLPVDVNHSDWDCTLEKGMTETGGEDPRSLRLGFRVISGFRRELLQRSLKAARQDGPFTSISEFTQRTRLGQAVIAQLSQADAFGSLNQDRRAALWQALGQEKKPKDQPLFADLEAGDDDTFALADTGAAGSSHRRLSFGRAIAEGSSPVLSSRSLDELRVTTCAGLTDKENNRHLRVAGLVILRQRPSTAKGITFVTLEDETGTANLVVKQNIWQRYYKIARRVTGLDRPRQTGKEKWRDPCGRQSSGRHV